MARPSYIPLCMLTVRRSVTRSYPTTYPNLGPSVDIPGRNVDTHKSLYGVDCTYPKNRKSEVIHTGAKRQAGQPNSEKREKPKDSSHRLSLLRYVTVFQICIISIP